MYLHCTFNGSRVPELYWESKSAGYTHTYIECS
jgi:hypothetical protein